jgi:hypothetical protein
VTQFCRRRVYESAIVVVDPGSVSVICEWCLRVVCCLIPQTSSPYVPLALAGQVSTASGRHYLGWLPIDEADCK